MVSDWVTEELPYQPIAAEYFAHFINDSWPCLLDSASGVGPRGRFDIMSAAPFKTLTTYGSRTKVQSSEHEYQTHDNPFDVLNCELQAHQKQFPKGIDGPFQGGALGFLSYDLGHFADKSPQHPNLNSRVPLMAFGFYDWALVIDHQTQTAQLVGNRGSVIAAKQKLKEPKASLPDFDLLTEFQSNMNFTTYGKKFDKIKQLIYDGDCYQVNFAQRFHASYQGHPWQAYRKLHHELQAPYSAYFDWSDGQALSFSPELFLQANTEGQFTTRPIKGTRPRGTDSKKDEALKQCLQQSEKDQAENLMIVDLIRNDLSKSCLPSSVEATQLFEIESFPNVHHLVSEVQGIRSPDINSIQLLKACFPGGSITGTPKLKAMEIIHQLEPNSRSLYTGSIGYIGFAGDMKMNIAIRTLVCIAGEALCWAGGGIVADSEARAEYQESFDKVNKILHLLQHT